MNEDLSGWADGDTQTYLKYADSFVPRRQEQIDLLVEVARAESPGKVLELGCGDGRVAASLLAAIPDVAGVTLVDASAAMIEAARARLPERYGGLTFVHSSIEDVEIRPGSYDLVYSFLAIHHLDHSEKRKLYARVCASLLDGGFLFLEDLIEPVGERARTLAAWSWDRCVARASAADPQQWGAHRAFVEDDWNYFSLTEPDPIDKPASVASNLTWLHDAGFSSAEVIWLHSGHAVFLCAR
ncbi:class I SAM-dependent methyltransferase [Kribbella sp. NPDC026611]|uniref:class I SAM-dependent methyltransferase n=1 Tax=Kribbella sp. NPDC026611 TaxID=3154911 RepID=UPI0033CFB493